MDKSTRVEIQEPDDTMSAELVLTLGVVLRATFTYTNTATGAVTREKGKLFATPTEFGRSYVLFSLSSFSRNPEAPLSLGTSPLAEGHIRVELKKVRKGGSVVAAVDSASGEKRGSSATRLTEAQFWEATLRVQEQLRGRWDPSWFCLG
jgi:hypothetical protein